MNTTPRGQDKDPELPHLKDAMEKSWQELHAGKPAPELGKIDTTADNVIMAKE